MHVVRSGAQELRSWKFAFGVVPSLGGLNALSHCVGLHKWNQPGRDVWYVWYGAPQVSATYLLSLVHVLPKKLCLEYALKMLQN